MHLFSRLSLLVVIASFAPACSWYFGPGDEEDDSATTTTTTDGATDGDTTDGDTTDGDPGPDECLTVNVFLERFGSCLSFSEWTESGLCNLALEQTEGGDECADCHSEGEDNVFLAFDCFRTFQAQRERPFVLTLIEPFSSRDGCYVGFRLGGGKLLMPELSDSHPAFELSERIQQGVADIVNAAVGRALDESVDCSELD